MELQCSNFVLKFFELHVMALTHFFTSFEMLKLALVLFGAEALWCFSTQYLWLYLFAVGRKMTLPEVAQPWLYSQSRIDSVFKISPRDIFYNKGPEMFMKQVYYLDYHDDSSELPWMINALVMFLVGYHSGVRNE